MNRGIQEHLIRSYSFGWPVEVFFEDSKQDLGFGDCEVRDEGGASTDWHLQMLAYSLLRLGPESNASGTLCSKSSSIQVQLECALKEVGYNLFSWVRDYPKQALDDLMKEIDHLFLYSDGSDGSKGWYL